MRIPFLAARSKSQKHQGGRNSEHPDSFVVEDFERREMFRGDYEQVCHALLEQIDFDNVLDIGCANGFLLEPLTRQGKDVLGLEIAHEVLQLLSPSLKSRVRICDACTAGKLGDFDLVACVEVVEHIEPEKTEALLDAIVANCRKWIYFTAASPYQPGHGHINMRPHFYYLKAFRDRGFELNYPITEALVSQLETLPNAKWLYFNSLVFEKCER